MECILATFRELEEEISTTIQRCNSLIYESCQTKVFEPHDDNIDVCKQDTDGMGQNDHSRIVWRRVRHSVAANAMNGSAGKRNCLQEKTSLSKVTPSPWEPSPGMLDYETLNDAVTITERLDSQADNNELDMEMCDCIYANVSIDVNDEEDRGKTVRLNIDITDSVTSSGAESQKIAAGGQNSRMYKLHIPVPKNMNPLEEEGFLYILNSVLYKERETLEGCGDTVVGEEVYEYFV